MKLESNSFFWHFADEWEARDRTEIIEIVHCTLEESHIFSQALGKKLRLLIIDRLLFATPKYII